MTDSEQPPVASGYMLGDTTKYVRSFIDHCVSREDHDQGFYYFGIVATACYFESVLEDLSFSWCKTKYRAEEKFLERLIDKIGSDINRATGLDGWKQWLKVLFDVDLPTVAGDEWPKLSSLFVLRNQLAHGRTTKFTHFWNAIDGKFLGMTIAGSSYQKPFEHLLACGAINVQPGEVPSSECFFTHKVLLHFAMSVNSTILSLAKTKEIMGLYPFEPLKLPNKSLEFRKP